LHKTGLLDELLRGPALLEDSGKTDDELVIFAEELVSGAAELESPKSELLEFSASELEEPCANVFGSVEVPTIPLSSEHAAKARAITPQVR
jgi:hypothetical protein